MTAPMPPRTCCRCGQKVFARSVVVCIINEPCDVEAPQGSNHVNLLAKGRFMAAKKRKARVNEIQPGYVSGNLTAISMTDQRDKYGMRLVLCECTCGGTRLVAIGRLTSKSVKSCGCYVRPKGPYYHELTFNSWRGMQSRCKQESHNRFAKYGGRGIAICEAWNSYEQFYKDMGERPSASHQIDRIDNDGNYCPENCRWATRSEQARNKSNTVMIEFRGEVRSAHDWGELVGMNGKSIAQRIRKGWTAEQAITFPRNAGNPMGRKSPKVKTPRERYVLSINS